MSEGFTSNNDDLLDSGESHHASEEDSKSAESTTSSESESTDEEEFNIKPLDKQHKMLLQAVQTLGILTEQHMKELISEIGKSTNDYIRVENISRQIIQAHLDVINASIEKLDCTIREVICELSEKVYYMYYITVENSILKFQTSFTPNELEFFQQAMRLIITKHNDFIATSTDLLKLGEEIDFQPTKPEETAAEIMNMIKKFLNLKYLIKVSENKSIENVDCQITLGIRSVKEMGPVLSDIYKKYLASCCVCKEILLHGLECENCQCSFHHHCFKKHIEQAAHCPNPQCKVELPDFGNMPKRMSKSVEVEQEEAGDSRVNTPDSAVNH